MIMLSSRAFPEIPVQIFLTLISIIERVDIGGFITRITIRDKGSYFGDLRNAVPFRFVSEWMSSGSGLAKGNVIY